ncbi:hypothetical protein AC579_9129 [Pseudocercospora musae]|uniref:Uncharacterized protein n=1 Tax=Pseudocercospora musae TaxID=113226 RepID=A0A139IIG5_9PEZI|nr:hypothetical protein AC579_9129 [Pseudocercospora musae]
MAPRGVRAIEAYIRPCESAVAPTGASLHSMGINLEFGREDVVPELHGQSESGGGAHGGASTLSSELSSCRRHNVVWMSTVSRVRRRGEERGGQGMVEPPAIGADCSPSLANNILVASFLCLCNSYELTWPSFPQLALPKTACLCAALDNEALTQPPSTHPRDL